VQHGDVIARLAFGLGLLPTFTEVIIQCGGKCRFLSGLDIIERDGLDSRNAPLALATELVFMSGAGKVSNICRATSCSASSSQRPK